MTEANSQPGMKPKPLLFVISGPSGSGKGTALDFIEREFADSIARSPTYTTRARRNGERDGKDYNYVSDDRFQELVAQKEIFEFTRTYNDELYGSPRRLINADDGHHLLVELDFNGFHRLRSISRRKVIGIFIMPPSIESSPGASSPDSPRRTSTGVFIGSASRSPTPGPTTTSSSTVTARNFCDACAAPSKPNCSASTASAS